MPLARLIECIGSAPQSALLSTLKRTRELVAGSSLGHGGLLFDKLIFPLLLKKVYADKNRREAIDRDSGLDWVLVRPAILNDKPGRETIRALTDLSAFHGGSIARADVARFVLDQVESDAWLRQAPLIAW